MNTPSEREAAYAALLKMLKPVYANAGNTKAVRTGHELAGYVKYYTLYPHELALVTNKFPL